MSTSASIKSCSVQARFPQRRPQLRLLRSNCVLPASASAPQSVSIQPMQVPASRVILQVTILPALLNGLQQAVAKSCCKVVDVLGIEPVPRTQSIRVRLAIAGSSVNAAMEAIIRALPSGEIGRIVAL